MIAMSTGAADLANVITPQLLRAPGLNSVRPTHLSTRSGICNYGMCWETRAGVTGERDAATLGTRSDATELAMVRPMRLASKSRPTEWIRTQRPLQQSLRVPHPGG